MTGWWAGLRRLVWVGRWPLAVAAGILLVNVPALIHIVDVNPLGPTGLTASHLTRGLIPAATAADANVGYTAQALGHRAALDWLHGQVPWWNPYEGLGSPLAGEMQSAAFFPPVLLFALGDGSLYFHVAIELTAGLATWFLLRELGLSAPIATTGGLLFGLCGTFDWLWHATMNPAPFLPLALLGAERSYRRPHANSGWIILALALALSLYAGFPETAYLDALFVAGWGALRLAQSPTRALLARHYLLAATTGLLLSLPLLIPFLTYLPHASTAINNGAGYRHLAGPATAMLGLPYLYGSIGQFVRVFALDAEYWGPVGGFLTATTIVLAVAGLLGSRREAGLRYLLAIVGVGALLWSFGIQPYAELSHILPYMSHVWVTRYAPPIWELAAVIAACFGLEALGTGRRARIALLAGSATMLALGAATVLASGTAILSAISRVFPSAHAWPVASIAWSAAAVTAVTAAGLLRGSRLTRGLAGSVLVLDAAALAFLPQLSAPRAVTVDMKPVHFLAGHLGYGRYVSFDAYHSNYGSYFGIASLNASDDPVPDAWAQEITSMLDPNASPFRFDGAIHRNSSGPTPATQAVTHLAAYEALDVRYFVVRDPIPPVLEAQRLLPVVLDDGFVTILSVPHPTPYFTALGRACALRPRSRDSVTATCSRAATLVRSELYLPGWSVTVNGHPAALLDRQRLLTAVRVPAGRSVVRFSYTPPGVPAALAGFAVGLMLLAGVPAGQRRVRRRRAVPVPDVVG